MSKEVIIVSGGGAVRLSEIALVHWTDKERTRCKIWLRGNPTDFTLAPRVAPRGRAWPRRSTCCREFP